MLTVLILSVVLTNLCTLVDACRNDQSHRIIGTASGYADMDTLDPGEASGFGLQSNDLSNVGPIGSYQLSASSEPAFGQEKPAYLRLVIGRAYTDAIGTYHVIGEVTNEGNNTANLIKVSGILYDVNRKVIGEGFTYVPPNNLPAGQTTPFDMMVHSLPGQQFAYSCPSSSTLSGVQCTTTIRIAGNCPTGSVHFFNLNTQQQECAYQPGPPVNGQPTCPNSCTWIHSSAYV
jgi:hypothetical protein